MNLTYWHALLALRQVLNAYVVATNCRTLDPLAYTHLPNFPQSLRLD